MGLRKQERMLTRKRRDFERSADERNRRDQNIVKALDAKPCPDIDRKPLAGLMTDIFKDVLKSPDFEGLSKRDIIARICAELRIQDPDLSIWPDEKPGEATAPPIDAAGESYDPPFPEAAAAAFAGAQAPLAYTNGHDPP